MEHLRLVIRHWGIVSLFVLMVCVRPVGAQGIRLVTHTAIGEGLHPWYEVKADPESPTNLIICGTKWDALANAPFGFVYASSDDGTTWRSVLEDRNSAWVTEQSCAFGPNHRAYFISEASKTDVNSDPGLGVTRLYVSMDSGVHWVETTKMGWADYSTSAVSTASGKLYTFFQAARSVRDSSKHWGNNLGLLVFSPDGKKVAGPYFNSPLREADFRGVYPSNAVALKSGAVVALYYGQKQTPDGWEADLGTIRANQSPEPSLEATVIAHPAMNTAGSCFNMFDGSLAYDPERNRLFAIYMDGCDSTNRILLVSSDDEGRTWTKAVGVAGPERSLRRMDSPSLAVTPDGVLEVLWAEGLTSGRWLFSYIRDGKLVEPPIELSCGSDKYEIGNDSLETQVLQAYQIQLVDHNASLAPLIRVDARNLLNGVWRTSGLIAMRDRVFAIWSSGDDDGMHLYSGILASGPVDTIPRSADPAETDVTQNALVQYAYSGLHEYVGQRFDPVTSTLTTCLSITNRGVNPMHAPIKLVAKDLSSPIGRVSILNATNGLTGTGAVWNISDSLTGDQIPPGARSNPFCLSFHIEMVPKGVQAPLDVELLLLDMTVIAKTESPFAHGNGAKD